MDRRTRKQLKSDKFALEVQHGFEFLTDHKELAIRYGAIALAVLLIAGGIYLYMGHVKTARVEALAQAMHIDNATVGSAPIQPGAMHYNTAAEKAAALHKALSDIVANYHGSDECATAEFYLASDAVDKANMAEAERLYKDIIDSGPKEYGALAKLSLSKVYEAEGKDDLAEKTLRDLMAHPSATVSKDEAQIQLALLIAKKNPEEGRKMLEAMRSDRTAISRAAVQAMGDLGAQH